MAYDYAALKSELLNDPLARGYAAMNDAQAATSLNTANRQGPSVDVPARSVRGVLYARGSWHAIQLLVLDGKTGVAAHDSALAAAIGLVKMADQGEIFPMSNAAIAAQVAADLDALTTNGTILAANQLTQGDPGDKALVLALANPAITRAAEIGFGPNPVSAGDVLTARGS